MGFLGVFFDGQDETSELDLGAWHFSVGEKGEGASIEGQEIQVYIRTYRRDMDVG